MSATLAKKVRLVVDNLNIYNVSSFYETFEPAEAGRLIECLDRRIADIEIFRSEVNVTNYFPIVIFTKLVIVRFFSQVTVVIMGGDRFGKNISF